MVTLLLVLGVSLLAIGVVAVVSSRWMRKPTAETDDYVRPSDCCGAHEICERDLLSPLPGEEIVYFEDEELDRFRSVSAQEYTQEMVIEFQDVFDTLRTEEVAAWCRSLQLRGISIPEEIKEQILFVICENRSAQ